jgi:hypothetical protein
MIKQMGFDSGRGKNFSLSHKVQTGYEAHSSSYKMGTRGSLLRRKVAGFGAIPPLRYSSSWLGA